MNDIQQGRCSICYQAGTPGRKANFICGACADPDNIVVICECGARAVYDPAHAVLIASHFTPGTEIKAGTIIKLPFCSKCLEGDAPPTYRIEHYQLT